MRTHRLLLAALGAVALLAFGCDDEIVIDDAGPDAGLDAGEADAGPPDVCGGPSGAMCASGDWCDFPSSSTCGDDGFPGLCRPRPEACPDVLFPVCGCDGATYGNPCEAEAAGVDVRHDGECERDSLCGFMGTSCASDEWCDTPSGSRCGAAVGGLCRPRPMVCSTIWQPVCGCDGTTYANACDANAAGVDVAYDGECSVERVCGGLGGFECASDQVCIFPDSASCGIGDERGTCQPRPFACADEARVVCGCNGVTYASECAAQHVGVDVAHEGECRPSDPCAAQDARGVGPCEAIVGVFWNGTECVPDSGCTCDGADCGAGFDTVEGCEARFVDCEPVRTCEDDSECRVDEWCDFPVGEICGAGGSAGLCRPRPDACLPVYMAVCGCDGTDYGNACDAARAGTDIAYRGTCDAADRCVGQDATAFGPCDRAFGWYWDGDTCAPLSGCECRGSACGFGWVSEEACIAAHLGCDGGGDSCTPTSACPTGFYCDYAGPTCGGGGPGVCRAEPPVCPAIYALVCGCDGTSYPNACEAARAGVDTRYPGACVSPP